MPPCAVLVGQQQSGSCSGHLPQHLPCLGLMMSQVMMGFIKEWQDKLGVTIVCSQVSHACKQASQQQQQKMKGVSLLPDSLACCQA